MKRILITTSLVLALSGAQAQTADPVDPVASAWQVLPKATSLLVQREGRSLIEWYAHGADAATLHDTRSSTKSLTAPLVAAAVQDGLLRWDSPRSSRSSPRSSLSSMTVRPSARSRSRIC